MKHSDVYAELSDYLEGDLPMERRARIDAHLDGCSGCAGRLHELRATLDALRSLGDAEPLPDFADRVMARIAAGEGRPSPVTRLLLRTPAVLRGRIAPPLLALASAAIVIVWLRAPQVPTFPVAPVASPTAVTLADAIRKEGSVGAQAAGDEEEVPAGPKVSPDDLDAALRSPREWLRAMLALGTTPRQLVLASLAQRAGSVDRLRTLAQEVRALSDPNAQKIAAELEGVLEAPR